MSRPLVVVTGAAGGIGRALVAGLAEAGHAVLAVVRREPELAIDGGRTLVADITDAAGRAAIVDAVRTGGGLWALVNNAGIGMGSLRGDYYKRAITPDELDAEVLDRFVRVNATAPLALAMELLPLFDRRRGGRIVNVGTALAAMLRRGFLPYAMSKAALEAGSAVLARDLDGSGVTVHVVHPGGPVDTPMARRDEPAERVGMLAPSTMVRPLVWLIGPEGAARHGQRLNTRLWNVDAPDAAWAPIGWPQLATDSQWSGPPARSP